MQTDSGFAPASPQRHACSARLSRHKGKASALLVLGLGAIVLAMVLTGLAVLVIWLVAKPVSTTLELAGEPGAYPPDVSCPYKQTGSLGASDETRCMRIMNYCLDGDGNVAVCDGDALKIRVVTPDDRLKATWKLDFAPEAIQFQTGGTFLVAGSGRIAVVGADGKVLRTADLPAAYVSSLAWSGDDVFVVLRENTGFAIYRTNAALQAPVRIVDGLRGCCGQMDITARDGNVYLAANCEFSVVRYDRDGKEIARFGRKGASSDAWRGCCEPKNVCFDSQGNLYTAESNYCCVKKFSADGQFLGVMAQPRGISGCVRVTIAVTRDGSRIYFLDTNRNLIHILERTAEPAVETSPAALPAPDTV